MVPWLAVCMVFLGCMSNVVFLEVLVKDDPGIGNLVTFLQFLLIALDGFLFTAKLGTATRHIGLKDYGILVLMFFATSVANNYAFDFNVPMPLHIIFRAGSLVTNMIMGILILKKTYPAAKYVAVVLITAGIVICTWVSGSDVQSTATRGPPTTPAEDFFWWTVGIGLLTFALFLSARMGIFQEVLYQKYGKHPFEALFYTHLLPLPLFLLISNNLHQHLIIALQSPRVELACGFGLPKTVLYLFLNVFSQYLCISSVYVLTTECPSLIVTLVITLRKFASLIFSVFYFGNDFTMYHFLGTLSVFYGTIMFTELDVKFWRMVKDLRARPHAE